MTKTVMRLAVSLMAVAATLGSACAQSLSVEVLSSRPEVVSGGSGLVRIVGSSAAPAVTIDGKDVSGAFKADAQGRWVGLVDGLKDGDNRLMAKGEGREAALTLRNHAINATLFAGPQQTP